MATIRTSIQVHDGLSGALRHMNSALQSVVTSFEQMQTATNQGINTAQFESARRDLALASQQMQEFENAAQQAANQQNGLNNAARNGANIFKKLGSAAIAAATAYLSFQQVGKLINISDSYASTIARIGMMNDGLQTTNELQTAIYNASQNALADYASTAQLVTRLGTTAASAFTSSQEVIDFAELIQKQFSIAGTGTQEAANATLQLSQALASGVLRGDELNSIFEQAPNIIQSIASYLDVPIGKIREMAKDGELTAQVVKEAMFAASDDINQKFNSMPLTWGNIWTTMTNYTKQKLNGVSILINNMFNSSSFQTFQIIATKTIDVVVAGLTLIIMVLATLANWVAVVGQFFIDNWSWIGAILVPIVASIAAIVLWLGLVKTYTMLATGAQWLYNTAMAANPATWIIMAIVAAIALVIYATVQWADQTAKVIGFISGILFTLGAFIINLLASIANRFLSFAEFLINLFIDPVYAIKKLFYDFALDVLNIMASMGGGIDNVANAIGNAFISGANMAVSAVNWIIEALNKIPGIELGEVKKLGLKASGVSNYIKDFASGLQAPTSDKAVVNLPRIEYIGLDNAFNSGYEYGYQGTLAASSQLNGLFENIMGGSSSLMDLLNGNGLGDGPDYLGALKAIEDATTNGAKKAADAAGLTKDEIAYLRDQVAREGLTQFNNKEIKFDIKNENYINSALDIDGVIDRFGEKVEEVAESLGEEDLVYV